MSLVSVYADPERTTRNAGVLATRAGVSLSEAKAFLRDQAASQVRKRVVRPTAASFAPTGDVYGTWAADVMFMSDYAGVNNAQTCILTLLELNSRYVYARGLTAATSAKTAEAMSDILEQNVKDYEMKKNAAPIIKLRTDNGGEFAGAFAKLLTEEGIEHDHAEAETHTRLARLDRFHRTLRMMLGELFSVKDSHVWYNVLPQLIANYNARPSRALAGKAPKDIGPEEETKVRDADYERAANIGSETDNTDIGAGTKVRLQYSKTKAGGKDKWAKAHENTFTTKIYTVLERAGPNSFLVDVPPGEIKVWPLHRLQIVKKAFGGAESGPKIDKPVVRAQRMERRNISPEEVAAAQAAPARTRSERAPRVDYKKLDGGK